MTVQGRQFAAVERAVLDLTRPKKYRHIGRSMDTLNFGLRREIHSAQEALGSRAGAKEAPGEDLPLLVHVLLVRPTRYGLTGRLRTLWEAGAGGAYDLKLTASF